MGRPGRKRRLVLEHEEWALIADGVGTGEACRRLGIARKTDCYWWSQRGGLPRTIVSDQTHSSRYLSLLEGTRVAALRRRSILTMPAGYFCQCNKPTPRNEETGTPRPNCSNIVRPANLHGRSMQILRAEHVSSTPPARPPSLRPRERELRRLRLWCPDAP